jgi:hypothetical protein
MVRGKRDDQFIVPDALGFEPLSVCRQLDNAGVEGSLEDQFDLGCGISAVMSEFRSRHPLGESGLES